VVGLATKALAVARRLGVIPLDRYDGWEAPRRAK